MIARHIRDRHAGAILWVLNAQYFIVQAIVAAAWSKDVGYSWTHNTISDLADTHCGIYGSRLVCSPLHTAMNISFLVAGLTIIGGAFFLRKALDSGRIIGLGFGCMALAGAGAIIIGLFPENSVSSLHTTGAALSFVLGNLGMILLGIRLGYLPKILRVYTVLSGLIGFIALVFFMRNTYLGIDIGGMERFVSYPQNAWMMVFGAYVLFDRKTCQPN